MAADRRGSSFLVVLGLAALFLSPMQSPEPRSGARPIAAPAVVESTPATASSAAAAESTSGEDWCEGRLRKTVAEYLGVASDPPASVLPLRTDATSRDVLIATVPDPIDSGHDHYFDRVNEAVQRAVAANGDGRLRDRSWLPWNDVGLEKTEDRVRSLECRKTHPGLVIYRPASGDRHDAMLLLLVGESPTFGVHSEALKRALNLAALETSTGPRDLELRIAGPVFSGSASSLQSTIVEWWSRRGADDRHVSFRVITGSATGAGVEPALSKTEKPRITFATTTVPDQKLTCAFYGFLRDQMNVPSTPRKGAPGCVLPKVALLSEGVTEYGGGHKKQQQTEKEPDCCEPAIKLEFPPNLSTVRTAYAATSEAVPRDSLAEQLPKTRLSTSLRDERPPRDVEPNLSAQTIVGRDLALAQILDRVAKGDVSYVGIVATDVNDTIFVASHIRKTSSDVRLFTFSSDVLYVHPAYAIDLKGMFVASAFPFFGVNPFEETPKNTGSYFAGDMDQGTFDAVAALSNDGKPSEPPVWVAAVSGGRVWPLWVEPSFKPQPTDPTTPRPWLVFFLVCTAFGAFNGLAIVLLPRTRMDRRFHWSPLHVLRHPARTELAIEQSVHVFALAGSVATLQIVASWTTGMFDNHDERVVIVEAGKLVASGLVFVTLWSLVQSVLRLRSTPEGGGDRTPVIVRLIAYVVILAATWLAIAFWLTKTTPTLLVDRMAAITSGVSPLAVLLPTIAVGYVWTLCHLKRLHGIDAGQPSLDATPISDVLREGDSELHRAERALCRALDRPGRVASGAPGMIFWPVCATLTLIAVVAFTLRPILAIEDTRWATNLLRGGVLLSIAVLCATIARLTVFVVYLRTFLRHLRRHPIVSAFSRLPVQLRRSVEAQTMGRWDPADIVTCIQLVETLAVHRDRVGGAIELAPSREALSAYAADAQRALEIEPPAGTPPQSPEAVLGDAARTLLRALDPFWSGTAAPAVTAPAETNAVRTESIARYEALLPPAAVSWLQVAEELQASVVTLRLGRLLRQFRHFVTALIGGALFLILAVSLYAFEPRRTILGVVFFLTLGIAWLALGTLFLLDRDPVTSAIAGKPPGQVKWSVDLVRRVVTWGLIPILGAFAALYPEPTRVLFAWVDPIRRALTGSF